MRKCGIWLVAASAASLVYAGSVGMTRAAEATPADWIGKDVGRMSLVDTAQLSKALGEFFGQSEVDVDSDAHAPGVGPLLFNQFSTVDFPRDKYRLPSGQLILDGYDRQSGSNAIVVLEAPDSTTIAAAALLTHLCPKNGVDERFLSRYGGTFQMHLRCESDYSLVIFYAQGVTPDPGLNADLTRWAQASISARFPPVVQPARKLRLKRFVRVLGDRPIDLSVVDASLPLNIGAAADTNVSAAHGLFPLELPCSRYLEARKTPDGLEKLGFRSSLAGYLSTPSPEDPHFSVTPANAEIEDALHWLDNYCGAHSTTQFGMAVYEFTQERRKAKGR